MPRSIPSVLTGLLDTTGSISTVCDRCDGTGEVQIEREKKLDELSMTQLEFLFETYMDQKQKLNPFGGEESGGGSGGHSAIDPSHADPEKLR